jgi:hypothetical protein
MRNHKQKTVSPCRSYSLRSSRCKVFIIWCWLFEHRSDLAISYPRGHPWSNAASQDECIGGRCQAGSRKKA